MEGTVMNKLLPPFMVGAHIGGFTMGVPPM